RAAESLEAYDRELGRLRERGLEICHGRETPDLPESAPGERGGDAPPNEIAVGDERQTRNAGLRSAPTPVATSALPFGRRAHRITLTTKQPHPRRAFAACKPKASLGLRERLGTGAA